MSIPISKKTPTELLTERMKSLHSLDPETAHKRADKILCRLLVKLGYKDLITQYLKVPKWYS
jgi:hypothetical protein